MKPVRTEGEPHDRMTRLGAAMIDALERMPEYAPGVKAIVLLHDEERAGTILHGYDSDAEAMAEIFVHLAAVFGANGKRLMIASIGSG